MKAYIKVILIIGLLTSGSYNIDLSAKTNSDCSQQGCSFSPAQSKVHKSGRNGFDSSKKNTLEVSTVEGNRQTNSTISSNPNHFRFRRAIIDILFSAKQCTLQLSMLENQFVLARNKSFYSDRISYYTQLTNEYYVLTLRRLLI